VVFKDPKELLTDWGGGLEADLCVTDLDRDGLSDLVAVKQSAGDLRIFLANNYVPEPPGGC